MPWQGCPGYWVLCSLLSALLPEKGRERQDGEGGREGTKEDLPFLLLCLFNLQPSP